MSEDPRSWGYLPLATPDSVYEIDESSPLPPFHLHLIGNAGDPMIPPQLSKVAVVHSDLFYPDFYRMIQSMDMLITAFRQLECERSVSLVLARSFLTIFLDIDLEHKGSFTMAIGIECHVELFDFMHYFPLKWLTHSLGPDTR
jgi:hypothetical protein